MANKRVPVKFIKKLGVNPGFCQVREIIKDYERSSDDPERLTFDFAIQRPSNVWSQAQKSLLIHSVLAKYIIPEIIIVREADDSCGPKTLLDGKQRLTTIYEYVKDGFALSKNTPDIELFTKSWIENENGDTEEMETSEIIHIGRKKFSQLPSILQRNILDYTFRVNYLDKATNTQIEEQMYRINNGKSQTPAQKSLIMYGVVLGDAIKEVVTNDFIFNRMSFTAKQRTNSEDMKIVINCLMVLGGNNYSKLSSAADMTKNAKIMREEGWNQSQLDYCKDLFEELDRLLPQTNIDDEVFKPANVPVFIMNMDKYKSMLENGEITKEEYKNFLAYWVKEGYFKPHFQSWCDKAISDKRQVDARIDIMEKELLVFLGKEDPSILEGLEKPVEEKKETTTDNKNDLDTSLSAEEANATENKPSVAEAAPEIKADETESENIIIEETDTNTTAKNTSIADFAESIDTDETTAACMLMEAIPNPFANDFTEANVARFKQWYAEHPVSDKTLDTYVTAKILIDDLAKEEYKNEDTPILVGLYSEYVPNVCTAESFSDWLSKLPADFESYGTRYSDYAKDGNLVSGVVNSKMTLLKDNINKYLNI
ncbi:MAG: DUF262 domain-containing protein [Clostridiales bacterium]|nr:DUF262 domain-containing protein [Clostridiales bacterium]